MFLLGCVWITVFTIINNIFDMILVTNIYSKYHYYNCLSSCRPHCYVHVFDLHAICWLVENVDIGDRVGTVWTSIVFTN